MPEPGSNDRLTSLSESDARVLSDYLEAFRAAAGAMDVLLVDLAGHLIEERGTPDSYDPSIVSVLLASGMAAAIEMAQVLERAGGTSIFLHEGARFDLYAVTISEDVVLALVFDRGQGNPRIGTVYLRLKRAIEDLRHLLLGEAAPVPTQPPKAALTRDETQPIRPGSGDDAVTAQRTRIPADTDDEKTSPIYSYQEATRLGLIHPAEEESEKGVDSTRAS